MSELTMYIKFFQFESIFRSKLTGVAAGYMFMTIAFIIGSYLLALRLKHKIQVMPEIITIKPVEDNEEENEKQSEATQD